MAILSEHVGPYMERLRPERSALMSEMESLAERDEIPIVHWETGRLLAILVASISRRGGARVLEVGTAIGYSTLHMAEALASGAIVSIDRDPERLRQARGFLERAGVLDRVELLEGDALERIEALDGPFDILFLDATKTEVSAYLELAESKLDARALVVVDNLLMSGEVALPADAKTRWAEDSLRAAREFNGWLAATGEWLGTVLPVGDGVGLAIRRAG